MNTRMPIGNKGEVSCTPSPITKENKKVVGLSRT